MSVEKTGASTGGFGSGTSGVSLQPVGSTPVTKPTSAAKPSGSATTGRTIDVKPHTVTQSDVDSMESDEIMSILKNLDADGVSKVATAHQNLADTLTSNLASIRSNATTLQDAWQGTAAQAAMSQFQELHDQTAQLAAQAQQAANVYKWVAEEVIPQYKNLPSPKVESRTQADEQTGSKVGEKVAGGLGSDVGKGVGAVESFFGIGSGVSQAQANETARGYLKSLNSHLITANESLPNPIASPFLKGSTGLPPSSTASSGGPSSSVASAPGVNATFVPTASGATGPASSVSHASASANGLSQGNGGPQGTLSGTSTATAGPAPTPTPTQAPPPNSAGPSPVPTPVPMPNSGPGNDGPVPDDNALADENTLGNDTAPLGDDPLGNGSGGPGVDDAVGAGVGEGAIGDEPGLGMGMGGAGSVAEDGLDPADSVMLREANPDLAPETVEGNAVIGDEAAAEEGFFPMEGSGSAQRDDKERRRKAWLNDDRDIWGNPINSTPSVLDDGA